MQEIKGLKNYNFAGYDTVELANKYGTPLYLMSEEKVRDKCKVIKRDFLDKYEGTKALYASKAFLTLAICKIIESEGLGLDVVSGGELYTAIKADFPMNKIMFHGNNKSYDELEMAVKNEIGRIVVDNLEEIDIIEEICRKQNKRIKILIRVAPGVEGKTHKYISTGQKDSKFGIPLEEEVINSAVQKSINSDYIDLMGFHFHIGSNLFDNESYVQAIEHVLDIYKDLKDKFGFIGKEINTGGGFGIYYTKQDDVKPLNFFTDTIMETIKNTCNSLNLEIPNVIIEPGRWIVGEAGMTLYTIGTVKEIKGVRTYVSVDGGLPDNPRPALYGAEYEAIVANKYNKEKDRIVTIAGKCCESGDILIWNLKVPEVERGDILAVKSTGAYNYSMASNYNRIARPAVVLLSKERDEIIVKRETYDDLIRNETIPSYLLKKAEDTK